MTRVLRWIKDDILNINIYLFLLSINDFDNDDDDVKIIEYQNPK